METTPKKATPYVKILNSGMSAEMLEGLLNTPGGDEIAIIYSILRKKTFGELGGDPFVGDVLVPFDCAKFRDKYRHHFKATQIRSALAAFRDMGLVTDLAD